MTQARALYDMWCIYIVAEIDSQGLYVHRKHVSLQEIYGAAPTAVEAAKAFFEKHMQVIVDELERVADGDTDAPLYLLGAEVGFSFADILLAHCLTWAREIAWLPPNTLLRRYMNQSTARLAYKRVRADSGH